MTISRKYKELTPLDRAWLALAFLFMVVGTGTLGFVWIEDRSVQDSLYMTLVTISTLGMKAETSREITPAGELWIIFLIVVGIGAATITLTTIVSVLVEGHMRSILGRRKLNAKIASLSNHIIVCGYGRMGRVVCDCLRRRDVSLVTVDNDDHQTTQAEQAGYLYVLGDATDEAVLRDAGIERARALVAVLENDASDVFVTLVARDLNPKVMIAARAEKVGSESRLMRAGADKAICPQESGATRLANILTRPGVVDFIDFAAQGLELEAEQYHVKAESKLVGQSLREANLPRSVGLLVIALQRNDGQIIFNPGPDTVFESDDLIIITGQTGSMAKLAQVYS